MTALALPRELNYVMSHVRDNYRPFKFRSVMQIDSSIPTWAANVEVSKVDSAARLVPTDDLGPSDLPRPSIDLDTTTFKLLEFGAGYYYSDRELDRAAKLQINPSTERAMATARAAEQLLDETAASGDPFGKGLTGLGNDANITSVTAGTKGAGGTTWAVATADELLSDLHAMVNAVEVNSKEMHAADTIILPQAQFNLLTSVRVPDTSLTAMQLAKAQLVDRGNGPVRILVWDRFSVLGAGTTPRACAFNASDPNVCSFMLPKGFTSDAPRRVSRGWEIDQTLIMGGCRILDAAGAVYMDAL